ncbi:PAS domain-containing protein, partial [Brevundimonas denitrificans]
VGVQLGNTNWVITQGIHEKEALEPLERYSVGIWIVAVSTVLVILSILAAIWLTLRSQNNKAMAEQYKELAHKINAQRRLLGSINNTIDDLIGLTDTAGRYVYANPSLARFVNFPVQSIAGKTDRDLFGEKAARAMGDLNQVVLDTEQTQNTIMEVETDNGTRILRIEKSRLMDDEGLFMGIVTVAGDITDF